MSEDMDTPEEIELDFMDCPICGSVAELGQMGMFVEDEKQVFTWRTRCLDGHHLDNYWFVSSVTEDEVKSDVTDL